MINKIFVKFVLLSILLFLIDAPLAISTQNSITTSTPAVKTVVVKMKKATAVRNEYGRSLENAFDQATLILIIHEGSDKAIDIHENGKIIFSDLQKGISEQVPVLNLVSPDTDIYSRDNIYDEDVIRFPFMVRNAELSHCFIYLKETGDHQFEALRIGQGDSSELASKYPLKNIKDPKILVKKAKSIERLLSLEPEFNDRKDEEEFLKKYIFILYKVKNDLNKEDFDGAFQMDVQDSTKDKLVFTFSGMAHPSGEIELQKINRRIVYRYYSVEPEDRSVPLVDATWKDVLVKEVTFPLKK